ncbi:hypothetical protein NX059_004036 [Plenodomus lindquistii]|nr:hypothetical protein NX059_004036 [Plenodomus lindquistii]
MSTKRKRSPGKQDPLSQTPRNSRGTVRWFPDGLVNPARIGGKYSTIVKRNSRTSPLLKLPPELRTAVLDYIFLNEEIKVTHRRTTKDVRDLQNLRFSRDPNLFALCTTSRQLHHEVRLFLYTKLLIKADTSELLVAGIQGMHPTFRAELKHMQVALTDIEWDIDGVLYSRDDGLPTSAIVIADFPEDVTATLNVHVKIWDMMEIERLRQEQYAHDPSLYLVDYDNMSRPAHLIDTEEKCRDAMVKLMRGSHGNHNGHIEIHVDLTFIRELERGFVL